MMPLFMVMHPTTMMTLLLNLIILGEREEFRLVSYGLKFLLG